MSVESSRDEHALVAECAKHLSAPAGHAFLRLLRVRCNRRMHAAANAPKDTFSKRQGAYQELDQLIRDLEKAQEK